MYFNVFCKFKIYNFSFCTCKINLIVKYKIQVARPSYLFLRKIIYFEKNNKYNLVFFHADGDTEEYISNQKYKAKFSEIIPNHELKPSSRTDAGYAFDSESQIVYMFGGHSDETSQDLNDFWQYNLKTNSWSIINEDTPISARCGQKMIFDPVSRYAHTFDFSPDFIFERS